MAALQFRCWSKPNFAIGSETRFILPRAAQLRSCSSAFRRSDLVLRRDGFSTRRVPAQRRVCASLSADDVRAACANALAPVINAAPLLLSRVSTFVQELPPTVQLAAVSVALIVCAFWGLDSPMRLIWGSVSKVSASGEQADSDWEKCQTRAVLNSYVRPLVLWAGILALCRSVDMLELVSEAGTTIKFRLTHFVRSLATVSVFALCTGSLIQQVQKYLMKESSLKDVRSVSLPFISSAVSTSVWVAAVCLFLELLGFSTRRWLAAGGFGTVLLTLAGREIFTNFLSSVMIHATKPFVESEWIQTKIEGQEVQGTVEHVGWWSPTVIRGDDREAVLIPNHKFSVSVVRNLTQKTHWRVKTHIALNHNDVKKVNKIVADMRKVLAKHPDIEQKRLHRRVFLDYVNSQNLALMILVSCFVKTSRFEKYLVVKEDLLMDLLKLVSHHGGRLATPVRSMQRHVEEPSEPQRPSSVPEPILLTAVSTGDSNPQKVYQRQQSAKESSSVDTVATVTTVSTDGEDALSKSKALKGINTVPATVEPPPSDDEGDDVKEPDNRRLETKSQKDSSSASQKDGSSQSIIVPATVEPPSGDEDDDVREPDNRRIKSISLKDSSTPSPKDGSSLSHKDGSSLPHKDGSSLPHRDGSSLPQKGGSSIPHKDGSSLPHKGGSSLPHKGGSSLPHKGGSSPLHKGGSSLSHKAGSSQSNPVPATVEPPPSDDDVTEPDNRTLESISLKDSSSQSHKDGSSLHTTKMQ